MATTFLFFKPSALPVDPATMDRESVIDLPLDEAAAALVRLVPDLEATSAAGWRGSTGAGWVEFAHGRAPPPATLHMRCSLRSDYRPVVQAICDATGWIAFGDDAVCYQPGRPPIG